MLEIGQQVIGQGGARGVVSAIYAPEPGSTVYMLGAGRMEKVGSDVEVIFADHISRIPDTMAADWAARVNGAPILSADEVAQRRETVRAATALRVEAAARQREAEAARRVEFLREASERVPAGTKAVIVAELRQGESDSMTDYFGSKTCRTVILAFSKHPRDLFPELRAAARTFAETADLADAPASAEHREKYSMGGGYYLKAGYRHSTGWLVHKSRLYQGLESIPVGEWSPALSGSPPPPPRSDSAPVTGAQVIEHFHDKIGAPVWIVTLGERVERAEFERLRDMAKHIGRGWWSRAWQGSPAGFAFKVEADAHAFAGGQPAPDGPTDPPISPRPPTGRKSALAPKFREMADAMQRDIDHRLADRRTNTPKRQREAQSARLDGYQLERAQTALRLLADHHDSGTVPPDLAAVSTKAAVIALARGEIIRNGGYYDAGHESGAPAEKSAAALALWRMIGDASHARREAESLRALVERAKLAGITGYFPTPAPVIAQMVERARLPEGGRLLEPSAGSGSILDAVRADGFAGSLVAFEVAPILREILRLKGYELAGSDFAEDSAAAGRVDRVLMNPPFERGQDIEHVRLAFGLLAPGGRLVSVMSPGPFYRSDAKSAAFREWFDAHGGEREDLPAGAFKESGTGVASVLVVIDRDGEG